METKRPSSISQREQGPTSFGLIANACLKTGDGVQMASLRREFQALGISIGVHDGDLADAVKLSLSLFFQENLGSEKIAIRGVLTSEI